jgi:putative redox protein
VFAHTTLEPIVGVAGTLYFSGEEEARESENSKGSSLSVWRPFQMLSSEGTTPNSQEMINGKKMSDPTNAETKIARLRYAGGEAFVAESPSGHAMVTSFGHDKPTATSPMELLLVALGGCTGADVVSILEKKRQVVTGYEIEVRAERRAEHPRIYTRIEVVHFVRGRAIDSKAVQHAIELSENKYCSVSAMLGSSAELSMRYEIKNED